MYLLTKVMLIMWTKDLRQSSIRFLKGPIHQKLITGLSDLHGQIPGSRGTDIRILLFMVAVLCNIVKSKNYVSLNDYGKAPVKNGPEKNVLEMG